MKLKRITMATAIAAASALVLAGCTPPYESEVIEGTKITVSWNELIASTNTDSSGGNNASNAVVTYMTTTNFFYYDNGPTLVRNENFGKYEVVSEDPLQVKYEINDGVKWSDGTQIDEADMLLAWVAAFGQLDGIFVHANPQSFLVDGKLPELGNRQLTVEYAQPYVDWEVGFAVGVAAHGTVMMAYPDITDAKEAKDKFVEAVKAGDKEWLAPVAEVWNNGYSFKSTPSNELVLLSSGPYKIETVKEKDYVTLVANDVFTWGTSPKYEQITVRAIDDPTVQIQSLGNGDIQIAAGQPTPDLLTQVKGMDTVDYITSDEGTYEHIDLTFNRPGSPFNPETYGGGEEGANKAKLVRQAFLLTIPRTEIMEKFILPLNPNAEVRNSILVVPGAPGYEKMAAENGSGFYPEAGDIDKAKELLAEAGVDTPVDVLFWYPEGNARRTGEFELIQASALKAGFNVIDNAEPNWLFTEPEYSGKNPHDATLFGWQSTSLAVSGSDQYLGTDQPSNFGRFSDARVDELMKELSQTTDTDRQLEIQIEAEQIAWEAGYGTTIFQFPGLTAWDKGVTGVSTSALSPNYFWNFWDWAPVDKAAAK